MQQLTNNHRENMKQNLLSTYLVAIVPLAFGAVASAQTSAPAPQQPAAANYSLESSTLKAPVAGSQQINATSYELSGTTISGSTGQAANIMTAPVASNAAAYKTESGVYLYPTAFAGFGFNDNVALTSANKIGSNFVNLAPQLVAELKHKGDRYTALASVNRTMYSNSSPDNSTSSEFELAGDNYFDARARMGWAVGVVNGTDARGSNNRPVSAEVDRWHANSVNGRFIYGAAAAQGRIEVDAGYRSKTYDNNRAFTAVADVDVTSLTGRVFYRVGTRTLALAEIRNDKASYASPLALDNNTERRYYLGLTWDATAATTGIVKVGRSTKDFDRGQLGYSGASWEAAVRWLPRSYSMFELQTGRNTADSSGVGTYDLNTSTSLTWNHSWTQSLTSAASIGNTNTSYGGSARSDSTNTYSLAVDYAVLRWLKVGVDLSKSDRSSSLIGADYSRNVTMFTLNASL